MLLVAPSLHREEDEDCSSECLFWCVQGGLELRVCVSMDRLLETRLYKELGVVHIERRQAHLSPCIVTCICCDVVNNVHSATVISPYCAGRVSFSRDDSRPPLQLVASTIQGVNAAEAEPQVRWDRCHCLVLGTNILWIRLNGPKWNASHTFQSFFSKFYWQYNRSWRIKHFSPWHFFPPSLK